MDSNGGSKNSAVTIIVGIFVTIATILGGIAAALEIPCKLNITNCPVPIVTLTSSIGVTYNAPEDNSTDPTTATSQPDEPSFPTDTPIVPTVPSSTPTLSPTPEPEFLWSAFPSDGNGWNVEQYYATIQFPNVDGDDEGKADFCGRGPQGIVCALSNGNSFEQATIWLGEFSDTSEWRNYEAYSTIQFPDLNVDGKADLCGRGREGIWCAVSNGSSFVNLQLWSSFVSDDNGWNEEPYYSTIQFPDVNADGRPDFCGHGKPGIWCAVSNGNSFVNPQLWSDITSDDRWDQDLYYSTIQFPNVDGDVNAQGFSRADFCGRGIKGIWCAVSNGSSFVNADVWTDAASNDRNWNHPEYYSTIQFPDVNADRRADFCGRGGAGIRCAVSNGSSFETDVIWSLVPSNDAGWNAVEYYSTIQFPNVDGDVNAQGLSRADFCGRWSNGIICAASDGSGFPIDQLLFRLPDDTQFWNRVEYYSTIAYPDVTGDGRADFCGRGRDGIFCVSLSGS
jgi:hypothetical protein